MDKTNYDLVIIGGGPAGLTAAIYTSRAAIKTLVIEGVPYGGQLMLTTDVENYPGFKDGILGPELIEAMREQAKRFGAEFLTQNVVSVAGGAKSMFKVKTDGDGEITGKVVLIASGASAKWLGLESENKLRGKGVSACATCDGFFFRNKVIAVVGGGDTAMEEALFLTKFAKKIYVLVRSAREMMRASRYMVDRALNSPVIEFVFNTEILEVLGDEKVQGLRILNSATKSESVLHDIEGLFLAIGHKPNTEFLHGLIETDDLGYVKTFEGSKTSTNGIFVSGDVADRKYRQAITAAGFGCMAALDIERYLNGH